MHSRRGVESERRQRLNRRASAASRAPAFSSCARISGSAFFSYAAPIGTGVPAATFGKLAVSLRTGDETYTGRGATQDDGRLVILLSSGTKELRMSGTLAKLKVEEAAKP